MPVVEVEAGSPSDSDFAESGAFMEPATGGAECYHKL